MNIAFYNRSGVSDTLLVRDLVTHEPLAKVPINRSQGEFVIATDSIKLGEVSLKGNDLTSLIVLTPGSRKTLVIDSVDARVVGSPVDSLQNWLWSSGNQVLSKNNSLLFGRQAPQRVLALFDSLIRVRASLIKDYQAQLTGEEFDLLNYQNKARAYSFLLYYGRMMKNYPASSTFFDFVDRLDNNDPYSKSLPDVLLYKHEIGYLRHADSIQSISSFFAYVKQQTSNRDLFDFLKASYIKGVIESPTYWRRHVNLFTAPVIARELEAERNNPYYGLVSRAADSFYSSLQGTRGFDFKARTLSGDTVALSAFKGKVVLIDCWATWCGPCMEQRPAMLALANKFKANNEVVFLMVSLDSDLERWQRIVRRSNTNLIGKELNIPDGLNSEFADRYLVRAIPKYILIDREGVIVNSSLGEPSIVIESELENELANKK